MLALSQNPPVRTPGYDSLLEMPSRWRVGHVKARCEKAVAFDLLHAGIGYFLPMVRRDIMSGGRKRRLMYPLFPSYIFLNGDEQSRYQALACGRFCQMIEVKDQSRLIRELADLEHALEAGVELNLCAALPVGQRCRVTGGPLVGVEGAVIRNNDSTRLVLEVAILGRGAVVEIDASLLEALEPVGNRELLEIVS